MFKLLERPAEKWLQKKEKKSKEIHICYTSPYACKMFQDVCIAYAELYKSQQNPLLPTM